MADVDDVRAFALVLGRAHEVLVRERRKFRYGSPVFVAFSADEKITKFAFPKERRGTG